MYYVILRQYRLEETDNKFELQTSKMNDCPRGKVGAAVCFRGLADSQAFCLGEKDRFIRSIFILTSYRQRVQRTK